MTSAFFVHRPLYPQTAAFSTVSEKTEPAAVRKTGGAGFVFVNNYQRRRTMRRHDNVRLSAGDVVFPPITVLPCEYFFVPFRMKLGEAELLSAAAERRDRAGGIPPPPVAREKTGPPKSTAQRAFWGEEEQRSERNLPLAAG